MKAIYDLATNDFPRDESGNIESRFDDLYIPCRNNIQIFHDRQNVLLCYIPSLKRGKRIVKEIQKEYTNLIFNIVETSEEVTFKFKAADIDKLDKFIEPKTFGAGISPFSVKNLPREIYKIPKEDLDAYKAVIKDLDQSSLFIIGQSIREFDDVICSKKPKGFNIKADKRKQKLKGREYIHSTGLWGEYISFLEKFIKEREA